MTIDGNRTTGRLTGVVDGVLHLETDEGEPQELADGKWLRWNHPAKFAPRPRVYFGQDSVMVAKQDWTGRVPIVVSDSKVTVDNRTLGKIAFQRSDVRCLLIAAAKEPSVAARLLQEASIRSPDDRVWLVDGDVLNGRVVRFDGNRLDLELAGKTLPILASRIAAVAFADDAGDTPSTDSAYVIGLDDGSLIEVADFRFRDGESTLTSPGGEVWRASAGTRIAYVQSMARTITYLSDLEPVDFQHTPYFSGDWPLVRDGSLTGGPLVAGGHRYSKGLAMHAAARAVYRVPYGSSRFCAEIALEGNSETRGSVVFRIYRVAANGLELAYQSGVVRGGDAPQTATIDVVGAAAVVLVVDYAERGDERDRAAWLDARFVP